MTAPIRLTELAHGGGCGCKLSPAVLREILAEAPFASGYADLLVGTESGDDAAVYRINDRQAVIATTDFFMPIVDDPFEFGRIAATNALSDIYAMGGTPIFALAILGMPVEKLPVEVVRRIVAGGAAVCAAAGIPVAGGHSIDSPEPIYGLAAIGLIDPRRVLRNDKAEPGDRLLLTKPLGVGIFSAALKKGELGEPSYEAMLAATTQLNTLGRELPEIAGVHSVTDVTGFGLLGHGLEMCRGASLGLRLESAALPFFPEAVRLAESGIATGASTRNWASYGAEVDLPPGLPEWRRHLLCDPQTSGGLLIACEPAAAGGLVALAHRHGFTQTSDIGEFTPGPARIRLS